MIYNLNKEKGEINRAKGLTLKDIDWKEENIQELLYNNLDVLLPEDELLLIMQSRKWQEEPDLMGIDRNGTLFIFELKAWESQDFNLLQVMRYGQIFGQYNYAELNALFLKFYPNEDSLIKALNRKFDSSLVESSINNEQKFVLVTNGLDFKTRSAILYWSGQGLNISSWIYKIYKIEDQILLDFETYRNSPNPYEDIDEGYYVLNTNFKDGNIDDENMIKNGKAAAFFNPWKLKIEQLNKGDKVFLYRSGTGIVAKGVANGVLERANYRNLPEHKDEEYSMKLNKFELLDKAITASEIKKIAGVNYVFMQTMFSIDKETGEKLWNKK